MYCGNCLYNASFAASQRVFTDNTSLSQALSFSRGKGLSKDLPNYGTVQGGRFR